MVRSRWGVTIGLVVLVLVGGLSPSAQAAMPAVEFGDAAGIHVESVTRVSPRQYDISVSTAALGRAVDVRVLVPDGYDATSPLPVLYLFHGTSGRASDWVETGEAEQATASLPLIVVMPDAGFDGNGGGWFTDWVDTTTALGPSQWETFHIDQLVPWIDANLRTVATRSGRAVAGLSQGGFGSTTYAARHPDLFVSAASFSGAPDIDWDPVVAAGATVIIEGTAVGLDGVQPEAMFGSRVTDEINWQGHDPADLVTNLRDVDVWLYTATGAPGPLDPAVPNPGAGGIELATHGSTISFVQRARDQGVPVHLDDYVLGTHSWPYWARDLREYLVPLMATFASSPAAPQSISYQTIDREWSQWGWSVTMRRAAEQQFSALSDAGPRGFTLRGAGAASVTSPPFYEPGAVVHITSSGTLGTTETTATADDQGRLHLDVALGPDQPTTAVVGVPTPPPWSTTVVVRPEADTGTPDS